MITMTKAVSIQQSLDSKGELLIWTDISAEKEDDFNQWYDTEHMQERASIPGFQWSRRYHSETAIRPYLALYRTDTLHVFRSEPYRKAFENQTAWSVRNFSAMHNTNRRVNAVTQIEGAGIGGALSLVCLGQLKQAQLALELVHELRKAITGIIALRILTPDPDLSTPLPSENPSQRVLEPYLVIDTTTLKAAQLAGEWVKNQLDANLVRHDSFRLLWDVRSSELK
jgi:hypothetical protein